MIRPAVLVTTLAFALLAPARAWAIQPLEVFLASARSNNLDRREAVYVAQQRDKEESAAYRKLVPVFTARGVYGFNQFEAKAALPQPDGSRLEAVITPQNQLDGFLTVDVPLVDVAAWSKIDVQKATREAADARLEATSLDVERQVARAFYKVQSQRSVLAAAERTVEASASNLLTIEQRKKAGLATDLDLARASAEVERNKQSVANAVYNVAVTERQLQSLSGVAPEAGGVLSEDDLREEGAVATFEGGKPPSVRAAELEAKAQDATAAQQQNALLPSLTAQAQERFTNATGFANRSAIFTATLNATWRFDVGVLAQIDAQRAAAGVSAVKKSRAEQTQADDLYAAWMLVRAQIAACRAARLEAQSNRLAATLAKDKYAAGTALQLDVLQADRQAFQSEVAKLEADSDLKYARAALRIAAGRSLAAARAGSAP